MRLLDNHTTNTDTLSIRTFTHNYFIASLGALIMGGIVYFINKDHGVLAASIAGLKQAAFTFFLGGTILKVLESIVTSIKQPVLSVATAVLVSSLLSIVLVYLVHSAKGTPKPFESTLPTIYMAPIGFFLVALIKISKLGKKDVSHSPQGNSQV